MADTNPTAHHKACMDLRLRMVLYNPMNRKDHKDHKEPVGSTSKGTALGDCWSLQKKKTKKEQIGKIGNYFPYVMSYSRFQLA